MMAAATHPGEIVMPSHHRLFHACTSAICLGRRPKPPAVRLPGSLLAAGWTMTVLLVAATLLSSCAPDFEPKCAPLGGIPRLRSLEPESLPSYPGSEFIDGESCKSFV